MSEWMSEPPILEFSQDEIDLMMFALEMWTARIDWELGNAVPNLGHRWAGAYTAAKAKALVGKLKAW